MLLKLELHSNYSLQAIVLMLLQLLLGDQTKHLKLWEVELPTSKFTTRVCCHQMRTPGDFSGMRTPGDFSGEVTLPTSKFTTRVCCHQMRTPGDFSM
jgi:hypothetical protein